MFKISEILGGFDYEYDPASNPHSYIESLTATKKTCDKILKDACSSQALERYFSSLMDNFSSHEEIFLNCFFHIKNSEDFLSQHILNTMFLSYSVARWLELKEEDLIKVITLSFFIDLSLLRVDRIVKKRAKFTSKEKEIVSHHPANSGQIFEHFYPEKKESILFIKNHHHYHYKKYKTAHSELKKIFEIIILSENFESLTHPKPHRKALRPHQAINRIKSHFKNISKETIKEFINYIGIYPLTTLLKLNTKEKAAVVSQNRGFPLRPKVRVLGERSLKKGKIVDLLTEKNVFVEEVL